MRQLIITDSSNVHSVGYDPAARTLSVIFKTGKAYLYPNIDPHLFVALVTGPSVGKAMQLIRYLPSERLPDVTAPVDSEVSILTARIAALECQLSILNEGITDALAVGHEGSYPFTNGVFYPTCSCGWTSLPRLTYADAEAAHRLHANS